MWKDNDAIIDQMIKGSTGELWGVRLEQSDHFPILKHLLDLTNAKSLIDLGCGAGDVSRVWKQEYCGLDLDWVIEKVSKICNPNTSYQKIDFLKEGVSSLETSDCLLMNAFLDVQEDAFEILKDICSSKKFKFIIVHRQQITNKLNIKEKKYASSYGNSKVPSSYIAWQELQQLLEIYQISPIIKWSGDFHSFLMSLK